MKEKLVAAEVPLPGEYIKMELEERGWTQTDLAEILGRAAQTVSDIINGKRGITPETATELAAAFGTTAEVWMNLQTSFDLWQLSRQSRVDDVSRRARLYEIAPVSHMVKRGWIEGSDSVEVLEQQVLGFLEIDRLDEKPRPLRHAARKSTPYVKELSPALQAWLFRAKHLAAEVMVREPFSETSLANALEKLKSLRHHPEDLVNVPHVLAEGGIRFIVVEPLPQTKVDGACFWLDKESPAIVLSLRYDRIDWFWHTLMHELAHIVNHDGDVWDDLLGETGEKRPQIEDKADRFAANYLVPKDEMECFIAEVRPFYSKQRMRALGEQLGVHPGIVVGQLQHRREIGWNHSRELLVRVRSLVTESAPTDGWGHVVSPGFGPE
ncbi:MAG TPA: HigA family addiction module antitoxin [Bacillota bacterium]|jgi:HTH-type transcriptional regulator/antitoxin HigA